MNRLILISRLKVILLIFTMSVVLPSLSYAAAQRMLLMPQTSGISIPPRGSTTTSAMCLDAGRDTPMPGDFFTSAPTSLGSAEVFVGGKKPISLQAALEQKIVSVYGTGDYESVSIESHVDKLVKIVIPRTSVVTPADYASTDDLVGLPQINSAEAEFDQDTLWAARAAMTAGLGGNDLALVDDINLVSKVIDWKSIQDAFLSEDNVYFPVQRVVRGDVIRYFLYRSDGAIVSVNRNDLDTLAIQIRNENEKRATKGRSFVYFFGEGSVSDFDAASLTFAHASAGGGGSKVPIDIVTSAPEFPPGGSGWNTGRDISYGSLRVASRDDGTIEKTVQFLDIGSVILRLQSVLVPKWPAFLTAMTLGVEDAAAEQDISAKDVNEVAASIERHVQERIDQEKQTSGIKFPSDAVHTDILLKGSLFKRKYVELRAYLLIATTEGIDD